MANDFQRFAQTVAELAAESNKFKQDLRDCDGAIAKTNEELESMKKQREKVKERLSAIEDEQKALMQGFASTAAPQVDRQNAVRDNDGGAPVKSKPEVIDLEEDNDPTVKVADLTSNSAAVSKTPTSLRTTFATPPKNYWFQCCNANKGIHPNYPIVVLLDGKWTEISCGLCGANAGESREHKGVTFFKGPLGVFNHFRSYHDEYKTLKESLDFAEVVLNVVQSFDRRLVSDEDVELLKQGKEPDVEILKKVRPPLESALGDAPHKKRRISNPVDSPEFESMHGTWQVSPAQQQKSAEEAAKTSSEHTNIPNETGETEAGRLLRLHRESFFGK